MTWFAVGTRRSRGRGRGFWRMLPTGHGVKTRMVSGGKGEKTRRDEDDVNGRTKLRFEKLVLGRAGLRPRSFLA